MRKTKSPYSQKLNFEEETISYIKSLEQKIQKQAFRLSESENYKLKLENLIKEIDNQQLIPIHNKDFEMLSEKIRIIKNAYNQFENLRNDLENVLIQKKKLHLESSNEIEKLFQENKQLLSENAELKAQIEDSNYENKELLNLKEELRSSTELSIVEKMKLKQLINNLEQEKINLTSKVKFQDEDLSNLKRENDQLQNKIKSFQLVGDNYQGQFDQLLKEKVNAEKELFQNIEELNYKKNELYSVKVEKEDLQSRNRDLEENLFRLDEKLKLLNGKLTDKEKEIKKIKRK